MTEKITKNILALQLEIQFAGKPWNVDGKSGITKESISIKKGKGFIKIDPIEMVGIWAIIDSKSPVYDKKIVDEVFKRAEVQSKELRQFIPK